MYNHILSKSKLHSDKSRKFVHMWIQYFDKILKSPFNLESQVRVLDLPLWIEDVVWIFH